MSPSALGRYVSHWVSVKFSSHLYCLVSSKSDSEISSFGDTVKSDSWAIKGCQSEVSVIEGPCHKPPNLQPGVREKEAFQNYSQLPCAWLRTHRRWGWSREGDSLCCERLEGTETSHSESWDTDSVSPAWGCPQGEGSTFCCSPQIAAGYPMSLIQIKIHFLIPATTGCVCFHHLSWDPFTFSASHYLDHIGGVTSDLRLVWVLFGAQIPRADCCCALPPGAKVEAFKLAPSANLSFTLPLRAEPFGVLFCVLSHQRCVFFLRGT